MPEIVVSAAAEDTGLALASKLIVPALHHTNRQRVAGWEVLNDRDPTAVRLASPRDLVSECHDRRLTVASQQGSLAPELFEKAHGGCCRVLSRALLSNHCCAHERLDVKQRARWAPLNWPPCCFGLESSLGTCTVRDKKVAQLIPGGTEISM